MIKNIVIVVSAMNMGGAQRVVSILANGWSQKGYEIRLICTFTGKKENHYSLDKNIRVEYLSNNPYFPKNKIVNWFWKLISLRKSIRSQDPDVVISFLARINLASRLSTLGLRYPLVICERTWPPFASLNNKFLWFYKFLFKGVDKIIVQTQKSKLWLIDKFSYANIAVIPNPVIYPLPSGDDRSTKPDNFISSGKKILLASGRLHKFKQFDLLIRAFNNIKDHHKAWNLVILGDGEEKDNLEHLIRKLNLEERVFLPGKVSNISDWYKESNLFVLSSFVEGFPNVLLEAMSYGLPVVSFDCDTGPRDIIEQGVNGILVSTSEKEIGLIEALDKMMSDSQFRISAGHQAVQVREKFSITNIMEEWDNALFLSED